MPRYIDADALVSILNAKADMANTNAKLLFVQVAGMVNHLPAADVVEVVRCKDCDHFLSCEDDPAEEGYCVRLMSGMYGDGFCCYGERKEKNDG